MATGMRAIKIRRDPFRPATPVPRVVQVVFWGLLLEGVAGGILALIGLVSFRSDIYFERHEPDAGNVAALAISLVFSIARAALWIWVPFRLRRGARWARNLLTISAAVGIVGTAILAPDWFGLATIIVLSLAPIVLLWVPPSNRFFAAVAIEKQQYLGRQLH